MSAKRGEFDTVSRWALVALVGWSSGAIAGLGWLTPASAGACAYEFREWTGDSAQDVRDTDDGEDEENDWWFHGGRDFGRSLACDDLDIMGQADNDDIGGGSGDDILYGGLNNDAIYGGASDLFVGDHLDGGDGGDTIEDLEPDDAEIIDAGPGQDDTDVRDGDFQDDTDGGAGSDDCKSNTGDTEVNCAP